MEATEVVNPNGNIERTIVLNPEESETVLNQIAPDLANQVRDQLNQSDEVSPFNQAYSSEEMERILDEAVGITDTQPPIDMYPSDNVSTTPESHQEMVRIGTGIVDQLNLPPESIDIVEDVEYDEVNEEPVQQENSAVPTITYNTHLNSVVTDRFSSAEWFNVISQQTVTIGGAGGISSWLALLLARTNVYRIIIYDGDTVEAVNLAGQFFNANNVGEPKPMAVMQNVRDFADYYKINCYNQFYDNNSSVTPVMMCGFDNMEARRIFYTKWCNLIAGGTIDPEDCLFIDGRLSAECLQVICIQGDDSQAIAAYHQHYLFSDEMADATVCSYKQTSFMANMIAATMVNSFVNWCANKANSFRPVPFFTEYDAVTMQYKIKMNAI